MCDELYPISVLRDITENQLEGSSDNYDAIEDLQKKSTYVDINGIKERIINGGYGFVKNLEGDKWKKQPTFEGFLGQENFRSDAEYAQEFFQQYRDWAETKAKFGCTDLLYVTAARYLLVTHLLYKLSGYRLVPCATTVDSKIVNPESEVCYPAPYGSATCTSDYDVGLVGKKSGYLTEAFNEYFQQKFEKPSELVFDTNVYAFTLEFAMPFNFDKLPAYFAEEVVQNEQTINFKMQELASAYFKVFKYNPDFFNILKTAAEEAMDPTTASQSKTALNKWLGTFSTMDAEVSMRIEDFQNFPDPGKQLRVAHNAEYQRRVKEMSEKGGYKPGLLGNLAKALIYAAEAYHTRGAIRHIVGGTQMKIMDLSPRTPLTVNDLWVSMIENWGESNKEYNHCKEEPLVKCFLKMSKYMWRVFNAMRIVRVRLPNEAKLKGVVRFGEQFGDPEHAMSMWLQYKRKGEAEIPSQVKDVKSFLLQFGCDQAVLDIRAPIPPACLTKMNDKINEYNKALASLVTDAKRRWNRR